MRLRMLTVLAAAAGFAHQSALAWDSVGHRAITFLAIDGLEPGTPSWLKDKTIDHMIGWEASEPDRWRATKSNYLSHENNPDHFMDIETLEDFGLTLETVPPLRYQFVAVMAVARHVHPENIKPVNAKLDPSGQNEWPGFVLHAIVEHQAKLSASFKTYRMLEKLNDPERAHQLEMEKDNIIVEMGILAHFVGDAAQPLHTTKHHHGWVGDNPNHFTTERSIHAYIDGGVLNLHNLEYHTLQPTQKYDTKIDIADPWKDLVAYIQRSHDQVTPLYELEKSGDLKKEAGKAFIEARLHDAASMLAALYNAAWDTSEPTDQEIKDFVRYDSFTVKQLP